MYRVIQMSDTVRIPPEQMTEDLDATISNLVQKSFEGRLNKVHGITVLTMSVRPDGEGQVIHGDGAIYQKVAFDALVFKPDNQEVVDGIVAEVVEFGAFVHIGPLDALTHMSQVMNDFMTADVHNERLIGKETGRTLEVGENVRARIVTASLNELSPRESKIGLTMRQPGLGKFEWIDEDRRKRPEAPGEGRDAPAGDRPTSKKQVKKAEKAAAGA
ncbi:MAG: DNA-directed polymerase subunit [Thermoplasmata archaeon]|jgi:DNA-directed RNA polymerase subunit E'|nr:DNA-directed polymerase subunit [Thermoplasmata archaeon]